MFGTLGIGRLLRWRWCVGALGLLIAHGLLAPATARAGCNNHLVTTQAERSSGSLDIHQLDDLIVGGSTDPKAPPRPCSGPGCSRSRPQPVPSAFHGVSGPQHWAAMSAAWVPDRCFASAGICADPSARPSGHRPSIFHPPPA